MAYNRWGDAFAPGSWGSAWGTGEEPGEVNLVAQSLVTGSVIITGAETGQSHVLVSFGVETGAPVVSLAGLAGDFPATLDAGAILTGAPVIAEPLAEILYELLGAEISTGGPSISSPSMTFISAMATGGVLTGVPQVGSFGAFRYHLEARSLLTGGPYAGS